ncbi:MAG: hypothetical protein JWM09_313 [Francisellaceae bacterium]|nr:hypothetical protein [Francisellaceae bacterium]
MENNSKILVDKVYNEILNLYSLDAGEQIIQKALSFINNLRNVTNFTENKFENEIMLNNENIQSFIREYHQINNPNEKENILLELKNKLTVLLDFEIGHNTVPYLTTKNTQTDSINTTGESKSVDTYYNQENSIERSSNESLNSALVSNELTIVFNDLVSIIHGLCFDIYTLDLIEDPIIFPTHPLPEHRTDLYSKSAVEEEFKKSKTDHRRLVEIENIITMINYEYHALLLNFRNRVFSRTRYERDIKIINEKMQHLAIERFDIEQRYKMHLSRKDPNRISASEIKDTNPKVSQNKLSVDLPRENAIPFMGGILIIAKNLIAAIPFKFNNGESHEMALALLNFLKDHPEFLVEGKSFLENIELKNNFLPLLKTFLKENFLTDEVKKMNQKFQNLSIENLLTIINTPISVEPIPNVEEKKTNDLSVDHLEENGHTNIPENFPSQPLEHIRDDLAYHYEAEMEDSESDYDSDEDDGINYDSPLVQAEEEGQVDALNKMVAERLARQIEDDRRFAELLQAQENKPSEVRREDQRNINIPFEVQRHSGEFELIENTEEAKGLPNSIQVPIGNQTNTRPMVEIKESEESILDGSVERKENSDLTDSNGNTILLSHQSRNEFINRRNRTFFSVSDESKTSINDVSPPPGSMQAVLAEAKRKADLAKARQPIVNEAPPVAGSMQAVLAEAKRKADLAKANPPIINEIPPIAGSMQVILAEAKRKADEAKTNAAKENRPDQEGSPGNGNGNGPAGPSP